MKVTKEFIMNNRTRNGAWTRAQVQALGIKWPPRHGWHNKLIGTEITEEQASQFIAGKEIFRSTKKMRQQEKTLLAYFGLD